MVSELRLQKWLCILVLIKNKLEWGSGWRGGTNVKLSVLKNFGHLSVKWLLIINYETYMYLFIFLLEI